LLLPSTGSPATDTSTLSLHDALPILDGTSARASPSGRPVVSSASSYSCGCSSTPPATTAPFHSFHCPALAAAITRCTSLPRRGPDRKSTRLNSSHVKISYAVFCLKKK